MDAQMAKVRVQCLRNAGAWQPGPVKDLTGHGCRECGKSWSLSEIPNDTALITEWKNDGLNHPTPIRTTVAMYVQAGATFADIADAIERTYLRPIPADATELPKVTGRYSKDVHRGGPTPFNALAYA